MTTITVRTRPEGAAAPLAPVRSAAARPYPLVRIVALALTCVLVVVLALVPPAALAAAVTCGHCGALNPSGVTRCLVCGDRFGSSSTASPSPARSLSPSPAPAPSVAVAAEGGGGASGAAAVRASVLPSPPRSSALAPPPAHDRAPGERPSAPTARTAVEDGNLVLESSPSGANVRIRGKPAGTTPLRRSMSPGTHRIALDLPGHEPVRLRVLVPPAETVRQVVRLVPRGQGEAAAAHPGAPEGRASGSGPEISPPGSGRPKGTLEIQLAYTGSYAMASRFSVAIDGRPAGEGAVEGSPLHSDLVRTYHYRRDVPAGPHRVRIVLLGVRGDRPDGSMLQRALDLETFIMPGATSSLHHAWSGGIEDFARKQACCRRGHRPP
jgi:hypothetical protein